MITGRRMNDYGKRMLLKNNDVPTDTALMILATGIWGVCLTPEAARVGRSDLV